MTNKTTTGESGRTTPSGLPLLYKLPSTLDRKRHAQASVSKKIDFSFARQTNSLPLNIVEFAQAMKHYPIVFTNDENPVPVIIVGLEKQNYFIKPDNNWQKNTYVPAYVRQYPFIFFEHAQQKKFYLCIDEAAPQYSAEKNENGNRLYADDGKTTIFTNNALKFCTAFYKEHIASKNFCAALKEHKLLNTYQSDVTLSSGRKVKLSGFQMIDEKAFNSLPDKVFLEMRKKGWLPLIYFALASTSNWKNLVGAEEKISNNNTL